MMIRQNQHRPKTSLLPLLLFLYFYSPAGCSAAAPGKDKDQGAVWFTGDFEKGHFPDSVFLKYWDKVISDDHRELTMTAQVAAVVRDGHFEIKMEGVHAGGFISLAYDQLRGQAHEYLSLYRIKGGDRVQVNISYKTGDHELIQGDSDSTICFECYGFKFSGPGSLPYSRRYELDEKIKALTAKYESTNRQVGTGNITKDFWISQAFSLKKYHFLRSQAKEILRSYHHELDQSTLTQLQTDVMAELAELYFRGFANTLFLLLRSPEFTGQQATATAFMKNYPVIPWGATAENLIESPNFAKYVIRRSRLQRILEKDTLEYFMIKRTFDGPLQQRLMTAYLLDRDWSLSAENKAIVHADIQQSVHDPYYSPIVQKVIAEQNIGARVYNFKLQDRYGKTVSLTDLKGKVVFLDFWFVGCGNCILYHQQVVSKVEQQYKNNPDVVFLTIATDVNKQTWIKGIESGQYTSAAAINLISDRGANHPLMKQFNIDGVPHPIVIDKNGNLFNNSAADLKVNGPEGVCAILDAALQKND
jgi:cytochrome oxidase Cu insertion factor (SCO1/SenC/PrrC family)